MDRIKSIWGWMKEHKIASGIIIGILAIFLLIRAANQHQKQKMLEANRRSEQVDTSKNVSKEPNTYVEGTDEYLKKIQPDLRKSYGTPPKGFIWDLNGDTVSLGNTSMSSEDVLYAYLRGISTLDFATVQKYQRGSKVFETYNEYFSKESTSNADYSSQFLRNMYKQALLSMEVTSIENSSTFANNKITYTVKLKMLDLTSKDFWYPKKDELFKSMKTFESTENDSTKLELFLNDYILNYYKSDKAVKRTISVDVTLQRYPDIDSGWLVSIDNDINDAARYTNGTLVTKHITEMYRAWVIETQQNVGKD